MRFFGRNEILARLDALWGKRTASFVTCRGRRRIGKSTLIERFAICSDARFIRIEGLRPSEDCDNECELQSFASQLSVQVHRNVDVPSDWLHALVAPVMKEKGKGTIINTCSVASYAAHFGFVGYISSKHAIAGLTKSMAFELGPEIRCNGIAPGAIHTAMVDSIGGVEALQMMVDGAPMKRVGQGEDIAALALFLASDESEFVKEINGVRYYNDSKGTNTDASITAIKSFENNIILLVGGYEKGLSMDEMRKYMKPVKKVIGYGVAGKRIAGDLVDDPIIVTTLDEAVNEAYKLAKSGDTVLLSPTTSSYDQYKNFEERGKHFKQLVNKPH